MLEALKKGILPSKGISLYILKFLPAQKAFSLNSKDVTFTKGICL